MEVLSHYYHKYPLWPFLSSPSGMPTICMLVHLMSHRSLRLFTFLHSFFRVCSSNLVFSTILFSSALILPSACSNLSLNSSMNFFISITAFSTPEFTFGFFLGFLCLYWYFHFVHTFSFFKSPFSSSSILQTAVFKPLLGDLPSDLFQGQFLLIYFFSFEWAIISCFFSYVLWAFLFV